MRKARAFRAKRIALNQGEYIITNPLKDSFLFHSTQELPTSSDEEQDLL